MARKKYVVTLDAEERVELQRMVSSGTGAARKLAHARILLLADADPVGPGRSDDEIVESLGVGERTVARVRQRFVEEGFDAAVNPRPRPRQPVPRHRRGRGRGRPRSRRPLCRSVSCSRWMPPGWVSVRTATIAAVFPVATRGAARNDDGNGSL